MIVKVVQVPAIVGLILCIVGATNAATPAQIDSQTALHVGVILFTIVLIMLKVLTLGTCLAKRKTGEGDGLLMFSVMCALPFLWIRLIYALLTSFSGSSSFNPVTGLVVASLFMAVLEEMAVVVIYLATGLKLSAVPEGVADSPGGTLAYRAGRSDFGTGKLGMFSQGAAAFQAFKNLSIEEQRWKESRQRGSRPGHGNRVETRQV
jgi:hypothetical protein